jgi:hypothetical protein
MPIRSDERMTNESNRNGQDLEESREVEEFLPIGSLRRNFLSPFFEFSAFRTTFEKSLSVAVTKANSGEVAGISCDFHCEAHQSKRIVSHKLQKEPTWNKYPHIIRRDRKMFLGLRTGEGEKCAVLFIPPNEELG